MYIKSLTIVLIMIAAVGLVAPLMGQTLSEQAKADLAKGEQLLASGDLNNAQLQLQMVIDTYSTTEWAWWARVRLSICYYNQKRFDAGILEARRVVNSYPLESPQLAAAWAQVYVGLAYLGKGDTDTAISELERVEQLLGTDPDRNPLLESKRNLALIYHGRSDRKKASALAEDIMSDINARDIDKAWAEAILGSALVGDKRLVEGIPHLKKVKDMFPGQHEALLLSEKKVIEKQYIAKHDYDGAIAEAKAIIADSKANEPRMRQARYLTILAYIYKKDYNNAIAESQAYIDKYPASVEDLGKIYAIKARAYAMLKNYTQAISCLQTALDTNPTDRELVATSEWDIATCYRAIGDTVNAKAHFQRLVDLYPDSHLSVRAARELGQ